MKIDSIRIKAYIWMIIGSIIHAIGVNVFLIPYKIAPGGITSIATVIYYLSNKIFPVGVTYIVLCLPLFIIGYRQLGRVFIIRTLFSTIFLSIFIDISEPLTNYISSLITENKIDSSNDYMLFSIFGGIIAGFGLGLILKSGATTGGTDLAARIINHFYPDISIGNILVVIDGVIVIIVILAFKNIILGLYAIMSLYVSSKIIDMVNDGLSVIKSVYIISDLADDVARIIMQELGRGVTSFVGKGMYSGKEKKMLYCVVQKTQLAELKSLIKSTDPAAFVTINSVTEVVGNNFKLEN